MNAPADRMSAPDRRHQILLAAAAVFGERGYAGGTTDAVARQAGVSQAYVVRMFGTKEALFSEVGLMARDRVIGAFRGAIRQLPPDAADEVKTQAMAEAYAELMTDRGLLLCLLQLFCQGHDPVLGPQARTCFLEVFRVVREEAGLDPQEATRFFAGGMLVSVLVAMRMQDAADSPLAHEMLAAVFGQHEERWLELMSQPPLPDARR